MKKFFNVLSVFIIVFGIYFLYKNHETIIAYGVRIFAANEEISKPTPNEYYKDYKFNLVHNVDSFNPENKQDILNIIYTGLNSGANEFGFYCSTKYEKCLDDVNSLSNDKTTLSVINNLVNPFNSYSKLYISTNKLGKVTITLEKLYSTEDVSAVNAKLDLIEKEIITDQMTPKDKIKKMHDYLINHSVYDSERADQIKAGNDNNPKYLSHKANGPLLQGMSLCSGYSDAMKIYLDRLNIPNYKISNTDHIWNFVNLDGKWYHLDLTWDDPVTPDKQNILLDKFFLIDTNALLKLDPTGHLFNENDYSEAKAK